MVEVGNKYIVKIEDYDSEGNGVGHIEDLVIFIPNAIMGEIVEVLVDKVNKRYARGHVLDILSLSDSRVMPVCGIYDKCGGCNIQHMDYHEQIRFKENKIVNSLRKIGDMDDVHIERFYSMSIPYEYRNKVQVPFGVNNSVISAGFYEKNSHKIIDMDFCYIQFKEASQIVNLTKEYLKINNISPYDEISHHSGKSEYGILRHVLIRKGYNTDEIMVVLVVTKEHEKFFDGYVKFITSRVKNIKTIILNINNNKTNVILGENETIIYGDGYITDKINDFIFKIHSKSFFQVNTKQAEKLYSAAIEMCDLKYGDVLLDAYCGIGTIGICASRKVNKVYGIEEVKESITCANENKLINNIKNIEFIHGKVEDEIENLLNKGIGISAVILDPPRKGVKESVLNKLRQVKCKKIVYVSCDVSTLARDIKILRSLGYKVMKIRGVDMFSQTHHVETIVSLKL